MMSLDWGTPGAGKTHNLMKYQVLPALKSGRTVFTNINGLDKPSCLDAISKYTGKTKDEIDYLLTVFPVEGRVYIGDPKLNISKSIGDNLYELVRLGDEDNQGDLIVLDEASDPELFDSEKRKVNDEMWIFFKKHRHYNVDICLMAHHPRDLIPKIARLCAEYTYYRKLIGFNTKKFRYEKWLAGYSRSAQGTMVKKGIEYYDDAVFKCYKSTVMGDASKDGTLDKRFGLWKSGAPYAIFAAIVMVFGGGYLFTQVFLGDDSLMAPKVDTTLVESVKTSSRLSYDPYAVVNQQNNKPKLKDFITTTLESEKIVYEGYAIINNRIDGFVSFFNKDKLKVRLTFDTLKNLGVKFFLPSFRANYIELRYKESKYYAFVQALNENVTRSVSQNISGGANMVYGE